MADYAPVMIWVAGPDRKCVYFNRPWLEFTGRALEDELGLGWTRGCTPRIGPLPRDARGRVRAWRPSKSSTG